MFIINFLEGLFPVTATLEEFTITTKSPVSAPGENETLCLPINNLAVSEASLPSTLS